MIVWLLLLFVADSMRGGAFVAVAVIKNNNNNKLFSSLSSLFRGGTRGGSRLYLTTSGHIMMKTDDADNIMKHMGNDLTISSLSSSSSSGTYMLHRDWFIDDDKYTRGGGEGHYDEYVANTTRCEVIVKSLPVSREVSD